MKRWWLRRKAARLAKHCQAIAEEISLMMDALDSYSRQYVEVKARLMKSERQEIKT